MLCCCCGCIKILHSLFFSLLCSSFFFFSLFIFFFSFFLVEEPPMQTLNPSIRVDFNNSVGTGNNKLALVIGNVNYGMETLASVLNDFTDVAACLEEGGFQVIKLQDATKAELSNYITKFASSSSPQSDNGDPIRDLTLVFYYAGHGCNIQNKNLIVPIDMLEVEDEADGIQHCYDLQDLIDQLNNNPFVDTVGIFIDTCRDNPFYEMPTITKLAASISIDFSPSPSPSPSLFPFPSPFPQGFTSSSSSSSSSSTSLSLSSPSPGQFPFSPLPPPPPPLSYSRRYELKEGMELTANSGIILFSTEPHELAEEGSHVENSPFTKQLLKAFKNRDLPLSEYYNIIFDKLRRSEIQQRPWIIEQGNTNVSLFH